MSLVGNYCYCEDGNWYGEAIWKGYDESGKQRWFLVLDDDDDPELVMRIDDLPERSKKEWKEALPKLDWFVPCGGISFGGRHFGGKYPASVSIFGQLIKVPPVPQSGKKFTERPNGQGVYYDVRHLSKEFLKNPCGRW